MANPGFGGVAAGLEVAAAFPGRVPARFNFIGFKTLGEFLRFFIRHGELSTNKEGFARSLGVIPRARKEKSKAEAGQMARPLRKFKAFRHFLTNNCCLESTGFCIRK